MIMKRSLQVLIIIIGLIFSEKVLMAQTLRVNAMPSWEDNHDESYGWTGHSMIVWGSAFGGTPPYTVNIVVDDTIQTTNDPYPPSNSSYYAYNHYFGRLYTPKSCGFHLVKIEVTDAASTHKSDSAILFVSVNPTDSMKVDMMIDRGLLYLYKNALLDGTDIYWYSNISGYRNEAISFAATSASVLAFEEQGHLGNHDFKVDPYSELLSKGLNYILSKYSGQLSISNHISCDTFRVCDLYNKGYGNGKGSYLYAINDASNSHPVYSNSFGLLAVIMSQENTTQAKSSYITKGPFNGWNYYDFILDALDLLYWSQGDVGADCGGWWYYIEQSPSGISGDICSSVGRHFEGSTMQWPVLVLKAAEDRLGIKAPAWVKSDALIAYQNISNSNGGCGYKWNQMDNSNCGLVNTGKTGGKLAAYAWIGKLFQNNDADVLNSKSYIEGIYKNWSDGTNYNGGWAGNFYHMYALKKGLHLQNIDSLTIDGNKRNWYHDMVAWLSGENIYSLPTGFTTSNRNTNNCYGQFSDGSWVDALWIYDKPIGTAHALLILIPHLFESPTAVTPKDTALCAGDTVQLMASMGSCYYWYPEYGLNSSTIRNPVAIANTTITYMVSIGDSTNCPCPVKYEFYRITIKPSPAISVSINDSTQCFAGNSFSFSNNTTISRGSISYLWKWGDGTTDTKKIPTPHTYLLPGIYKIKLIAIPDSGCNDSVVLTVKVYPQPIANFNVNNAIQCFRNHLLIHSNNSSIDSGYSLTYLWKFGDNNSSTLKNPQHSYGSYGIYYDTLIAQSDKLCYDTAVIKIVINPNPVAGFVVNDSTQCFNTNDFIFTNLSNIPAPRTFTSNWDFGDKSNSTARNPMHTYLSVDTFTAKLIVTSDSGCKDSVAKLVISFPVPKVRFTINDTDQCLKQNMFVFKDSTYLSYGSKAAINWSFGDGDKSSGSTANHSYNSDGTFRVYLTVVSNNGCRDSIPRFVYIYPDPVAQFTSNPSNLCLKNNQIGFQNQSSIKSGTYTSIWNFGDGQNSTADNPVHHYNATGFFQSILIITSDKNCLDTAYGNLTIYPDPIANFNVNKTIQCSDGNNFIFYNNSDTINETVSYNWDFNDGQFSGSKNPVHNYLNPGNYRVSLIITSTNNCKDTSYKNLIVFSSVHADFLYEQDQCSNKISFTNNSTNANNYNWNFGNGKNSDDVNPKDIDYEESGNYLITLYARNLYCSDTASQTVGIDIINKNDYIPNAFSPNNDGLNDLWCIIVQDSLKQCFDYRLMVYGRWGDVLYDSEKNEDELCWDGKLNGTRCEAGVYYYQFFKKSKNSLFKVWYGLIHLLY